MDLERPHSRSSSMFSLFGGSEGEMATLTPVSHCDERPSSRASAAFSLGELPEDAHETFTTRIPSPYSPPNSARDELSISRVSSPELPSAVEVHHRFNMTSGVLEIEIDDVVFRVHRDVLYSKSAILREIVDASPDGAFAICRLKFDELEVPKLDFERLLDIIYPQDWTKHSASTVEEWTSVLHLASRWKFETIRTLALAQLELIASAIDKIVLGRKYDVPSWLVAAYTAVCMRGESLSLEEARRLGIEETVKTARVQLAYATATRIVDLGTKSDNRQHVRPSMSSNEVKQLVEETFLVGCCTPVVEDVVLGQHKIELEARVEVENSDSSSLPTVDAHPLEPEDPRFSSNIEVVQPLADPTTSLEATFDTRDLLPPLNGFLGQTLAGEEKIDEFNSAKGEGKGGKRKKCKKAA